MNQFGAITGIQFEIHSARIASDSTRMLEKAFEILAENPRLRGEVSGHTSAEGLEEQNEKLSRWRAAAVKKWLVTKGIEETRIEVVGYGSAKPVATNDTEQGRMQNRRIEFRVLLPTALGDK